MYPTPQSSPWGETFFQNLQGNVTFNNPTSGRTFYVAKASITNAAEIAATYGSVFYPDGTPALYTTVKLALAQCVASRGDTIVVMQGHTETITGATDLAISIAGVTIVGLGRGSLRPTFTFTTAIGANIPISAANVKINNCIFVANFADITACFTTTTAPELEISDCEFRDTDATHNFLTIITTTITVNADGLRFLRNRLSILGTTTGTTPISILGTIDRVTINDNFITKAALDNQSCLLKHAALVVTNLEMARNMVFSKNTDSSSGGFLIVTSSTTNTGMVHDNYVKGLDVAAELMISGTGSKYGEFNNLYDGDVDKSGFVSPAIGSTA